MFYATLAQLPPPLPGPVFAGLSSAPTVLFTHRPTAGAVSGFAPPLFAPDAAFAGTDAGGLRWEVLDWTDAAASAR